MLACLRLFVPPALADSANWFERVWHVENGLPNNSVETIAQSADGYLWLGTPIGLANFDGLQFQSFPSTDFVRGGQKGVMAMFVSRSGALWLAMDRGAVVCLDGERTRVFAEADGLSGLQVHTIVEDGEGAIWIVHLGNAIGRIKDGVVENLSGGSGLPAGALTSLVCDSAGTVWWAKGGRVGVYRDGQFQTLVRPAGSAPVQLARAQGGGMWICARTRLFKCDDQGRLQPFGEFEQKPAGNIASVMIEDSSGAVWIGTSFGGLLRFDGSRFENVSTSHPEVKCLLEDREGNIWAGTRGGGLNRIRQRVVRLHGVETGLPIDAVRSLAEDANGDIWAVTQNGLLVRRSGSTWATVSTTAGWPRDSLSCVSAAPDGAIWIGSRSGRLLCLRDGKVSTVERADGLIGSSVISLLAARNGDLWIGFTGSRPVQRLRAGKFTTFEVPEGDRTPRAMTEDANGNVWIGFSRGMLLRVQGDELVDVSPKELDEVMSIRCLAASPDGCLWIGYAGRGLGLFKGGRYTWIGTEQGLIDDYISQIIPDDNGWLWIGSDHGIFKVRQQDVEAVANGQARSVRSIRYGRGEGVPDLQASFGNAPGGVLGRNGCVWLPTQSALAEIDTRQRARRSELPDVLLTHVTVDGRVIARNDRFLPGSAALAGVYDLRSQKLKLRLPPANRRLEIRFTTLLFSGLENVRFRYRLAGLDEEWLEAGSERRAMYSRLPAGQYKFEVRACSPDGVWSGTGPTLAMMVQPFFWQTWWFRMLLGVGFTGATVSIVRYASFRRLRRRLQEAEKQAAVERERARIARDIHDDLGNRLTKVMLLSGFVMRDWSKPEKAEQHVQQIASTVRQATDALDEIVWAINPRNDTLPHLINYVGQFVVEFLRAAGIRCRVDLPDHPPHRMVPAEVRHDLFMAIEEAITNIVRHAKASAVQFNMAVSDERITVTIIDNGRGFRESPDEMGGDGLRNMRQRMKDVGGEIRIVSEPGTGTHLLFDCPLPRNGG